MGPVIDEKLCSSCGRCVETCPQGVFGWNEDGCVVVERPEECAECTLCVEYCPEGAIFLDV